MEDIQCSSTNCDKTTGYVRCIRKGRLKRQTSRSLASDVDAYLQRHEGLRGVLSRAKSFPGWSDSGALLARLTFLKAHLRRTEKVAVVADGAMANVMPNIANYFVHAQVQHFALTREDAAWAWLEQSGNHRRGELRSAIQLAG